MGGGGPYAIPQRRNQSWRPDLVNGFESGPVLKQVHVLLSVNMQEWCNLTYQGTSKLEY